MIERQMTGRSYAIALFFMLLTAPVAAQNLIQNPNFTDEIAPWRVSTGEIGGFRLGVEGTGHSLVLTVTSTSAPAGSSWGSSPIFQRVPVSPGTQYRLAGNVRVLTTCGIASYGSLSLTWRDANENWLGLAPSSTPSYHDVGTYQPSITVTAPANASLAGVALNIGASQSTTCASTIEYWGIELTPVGSVACTPSATNLCLNGGRFQVSARWTTSDGKSGDGQAVRLTPDTGYFWFFNPANTEMTIKVLNACSLGGTYWVFAGGMTDVQVDITVKDTKSGVVRTYRNPLGTPFATITDTSAFATCP